MGKRRKISESQTASCTHWPASAPLRLAPLPAEHWIRRVAARQQVSEQVEYLLVVELLQETIRHHRYCRWLDLLHVTLLDLGHLCRVFGVEQDHQRVRRLIHDAAGVDLAALGGHGRGAVLIRDDLARFDNRFAQILQVETPGDLAEV